MSYLILMPVFARNVLHVGSQGFGFLQSVGGAGALVGVLAVAWFSHSRKKDCWLFWAPPSLVFCSSRSRCRTRIRFPLTLALVLGIAGQFYMTTISTILQVNLPNQLRGRVMSIYGLAWELMPVGGMIAGAIAEFAGAQFAVALAAQWWPAWRSSWRCSYPSCGAWKNSPSCVKQNF